MSCSIFSRSIGTYLMVGIFINRRVNDYIGNVVLLSSFYALFDIKLICPVYLYNANSVIFREVDKMVNRFSNHSFIFAIPHNTHSQIIWWILGTGFITAFFPYTLYSLGLSKMDAGKASILVSIELVAEAVFGSIVFHESLTTASVVGIALVLSAIIVLNLRRSKLK